MILEESQLILNFPTEIAFPEISSMEFPVAYVGDTVCNQFLKVMTYFFIRLKIVSLNRIRCKCSFPSEFLRYNYYI